MSFVLGGFLRGEGRGGVCFLVRTSSESECPWLSLPSPFTLVELLGPLGLHDCLPEVSRLGQVDGRPCGFSSGIVIALTLALVT